MATNPFPEWLAEVAADAIVVRPGDITGEARGNLWTFSLDDEQRAAVTPGAVEEFVRAVAAARGHWLAERRAGRMRFYCWHDAQAGQFRFSLVSAGDTPLPFGCLVAQTPDLAAVVRDFLGARATGFQAPLPVWITTLP